MPRLENVLTRFTTKSAVQSPNISYNTTDTPIPSYFEVKQKLNNNQKDKTLFPLEEKIDDTKINQTFVMDDSRLVFCNYPSSSMSSTMQSPVGELDTTPLTENYGGVTEWDVTIENKNQLTRPRFVENEIYNNHLTCDRVESDTYGLNDKDGLTTESDTECDYSTKRIRLKKTQNKRRQEFKKKQKQRKDSIGICNLNNKSSNGFVIENLSKVLQNRYSSQKPPQKQPSLNCYNTSTISRLTDTRSNTCISPYIENSEDELSDLEKLSNHFNEENDCNKYSNNNIDSRHTSNNNTLSSLAPNHMTSTKKSVPVIEEPKILQKPSLSNLGTKSCPYKLSLSNKNKSKSKRKVSRRYSQQELDILCFQAMYLVTFSRDIDVNQVNQHKKIDHSAKRLL